MSPFRVGETLIAGRYRLVRFIAQGGMGEVYEAFDEELKQRVAMKVVRQDVAANPIAMERFKREISLARRVTHPNVSRIFDFGRHQDESGAATFLTMELLNGPTLEERIRQGGPLPLGEALPVVDQMCEGLGAAHEAGVVHRDLKSSNVILAKHQDGSLRVVITDFGLARALTGDDAATVTLTSTDLMVGTPAYMSPEQAQGFELTPRSDVYSLGVVLFELVTGKFPHAGTTPMAILMSRLKEPPPSPLVVMPSLEPRWDEVIRRCLAVKPERRFESARDVAKALRGQQVTPPPPPSEDEVQTLTSMERVNVRTRNRRAAFAALALLAVAAGAFAWARRASPPNAARGGRRSAAVLGFKNLSARPDTAWLSTALSEMLTAELGAGEQLRTVPGETVARARTELALPDADALAPATLAKVGSVLGTDLVVLGSFFAASADPHAPLRVDLRLQEVSGHSLDAVISETGTPEQVLDLVASLGRKLRARIGLAPPSADQVESAHAAFPENAEARRLYAEGLSRLRSFDLVEGKGLLEKAAEASPKNPLIRSALAAAYTALGDDKHALEAAQSAYDLSGALAREERLLMEAQLAEAKKEWPKAIEDYRALFRFFPDDVEYALRLAGAQTASGHATDALAVLAEAAKLGSDPRVALAQGSAEMALSRYKDALASARRCIEAGTKSGARLLMAQGRMLEGDALLRLGDHKGASAALETARRLFVETGDRSAEARTINRLANVAFEQGDYERARRGFEEAGSRWREAGNATGEAKALQNIADAYEMTGDLRHARPLFERAMVNAAAVGDYLDHSLAQSNLAYLLLLQGDVAGARPLVAGGIAEARELGSGYALLVGLYVSARLECEAGEFPRARAAAEEALGLAERIGEQRFGAYAEQVLGDISRSLGGAAAARRAYEHALVLRRLVGGRPEIAETLVALAALARDEGKPAAGLASVREAVDLCREISFRDGELAAQLERSRIERPPGSKPSDALARVRELAGSTQNVLLRLDSGITLAAAEGDPRGALERVREEAQQRGLLRLARQAAAAAR